MYYRDYDDYSYWEEYYNKTKKDIEKRNEDFIKEEINNEYEPEYDSEIILEPNWYYSVEEKELEKVGDKNLVYDFYYGILYEVNDMGDYEHIGSNAMIYDENGEEMIF